MRVRACGGGGFQIGLIVVLCVIFLMMPVWAIDEVHTELPFNTSESQPEMTLSPTTNVTAVVDGSTGFDKSKEVIIEGHAETVSVPSATPENQPFLVTSGNVYVAEHANHRIQKFAPSSPIPPVANFVGTPTYGTAPLTVKFTDTSTGSPTAWAWFFGDETYAQAWMQQTANAGWSARNGHTSVAMPDGSIVLMGGADYDEDKNDVWRSTDNGATWTQQTANAGWSARNGHTSVAMPDGSIVLMGGCDINSWKSDVWQSTDYGATWKCINANAWWSRYFNPEGRIQHSCVVMPDGSIILMGGTDLIEWTYPWGQTINCHNDVWKSTDHGAIWTELTVSAEWSAREGHSSVVMPDGSIILMGGNNGYGYKNDVWRSTDNGRTWTELTASAGWSARQDHSSVVMPDGSIILIGGQDDSSIKNDVWRFAPAGSSLQNPTHPYTAPKVYPVTLRAYNTGGYNTMRKTAYINILPGPATMFRSDAAHTGVYDDGGIVPTNNEKWRFETGGGVSSSPAVANGVVYVGSNDNNLSAIDAATGTVKWWFATGNYVYSSPAVANGVVYVGSYDNNLYAIDAVTGTEKWRFATGNYVYSSPAVANGVVYVGSYDNNLYAIDAVTGTEKWRFATGNYVYSSPAVANGVVYVGSYDNNIYAIDVATGKEKWRFETGGGVSSSPAVANGVVYFGSWDGNLYAIDAVNGTEKWRFTTGIGVSSSPAVANGVVYVGSYDTNIYAIDVATGKEKWRFETGGGVSSSPAIANGVVYVGSYDTNLHAIDAVTGTEKWRFAIGNYVDSSPAVANGVVYIGSWDGKLYAFGGSGVAPIITQIQPKTGLNADTVNVLISGDNFQSNAKVELTRSGYSKITGTIIPPITSTQISCSFDLTGKATGDWDVVVTNPDGNSVTKSQGFLIYASNADYKGYLGVSTPYCLKNDNIFIYATVQDLSRSEKIIDKRMDVFVKIKDPSNSVTSLSLFDNETGVTNGNDLHAGDGAYSAWYRPQLEGIYTVDCFVGNRKIDSKSFEVIRDPQLLVLTDIPTLYDEFIDTGTGIEENTFSPEKHIIDFYELLDRLNEYAANHRGIVYSVSNEITNEKGYLNNYNPDNYRINLNNRMVLGELIDLFIKNVNEKTKRNINNYDTYPIKNIAIIGDDQVIPFYRVYDMIEDECTADIYKNPTLKDRANNYIMSDIPYSTRDNTIIQGNGNLPIPDIGVGRIFSDKPTNIVQSINQYEKDIVLKNAGVFVQSDALRLRETLINTGLDISNFLFKNFLVLDDFVFKKWTKHDYISAFSNNDLIFLFSHASEIQSDSYASSYENDIHKEDYLKISENSPQVLLTTGCHAGFSTSYEEGDFDKYSESLVSGVLHRDIAYFAKTATGLGGNHLFKSYDWALYGNFAQNLVNRQTMGEVYIYGIKQFVETAWIKGPAEDHLINSQILYGLPTQKIVHSNLITENGNQISSKYPPVESNNVEINSNEQENNYLSPLNSDGSIRSNNYSSKDVKILQNQDIDSSVNISVEIPAFTLTNYGQYVLISIPSGTYAMQPDKPILPQIVVSRLLPQGSSIQNVTLKLSNSTNLSQQIDLLPASVISISSGKPVHSNISISNPYPSEIFNATTMEWENGILLVLNIIPVQYNPDTKQVTLYDHLEFSVIYDAPNQTDPVTIGSVTLDKSRYNPDENCDVTISINANRSTSLGLGIEVKDNSGIQEYSQQDSITVQSGESVINRTIPTEHLSPGSNYLHISLSDLNTGSVIASTSVPIFVNGLFVHSSLEKNTYPVAFPSANLTVTVRNETGYSVEGLSGSAFSILLDGTPQTPDIFEYPPGTYSTEIPISNMSIGQHTVNVTVKDPRELSQTSLVYFGIYPPSKLFLTPQNSLITPNSTQLVDIIEDDMKTGLHDYNISINNSNPAIAEISAINYPEWAVNTSNSSLNNNPVFMQAEDGNNSIISGATRVRIGNFTITAKQTGTITLTPEIIQFNDDSNQSYVVSIENCSISVAKIPPDANFTMNSTADNIPFIIQFTDTSGGTPTSWFWDFGDGKNSTLQNPAHTYSLPGIYSINLTTANEFGTSIQNCTHTVTAFPPSMNLVARYGETDCFNSSRYPENYYVDYAISSWNGTEFNYNVERFTDNKIDVIFIGGDDSFDERTALKIEESVYNGKILVINYWSNRKFNASLPVSDTGYAPTGDNLSIVNPDSEISKLIFDGMPERYNRTGPNYFREQGSLKNGSVPLLQFDNGDPALVYWKYGKGYVIQWTLESMNEFIDNDHSPINSSEIMYRLIRYSKTFDNLPIANFTATPSFGNVPLTVQFNDTSTGSPIAWNWSFGDGALSSEKNPVHTFTASGTFTVSLNVTNSDGSNLIVKDGYLTIFPTGDFNHNWQVDIGDVSRVAWMVVGRTPVIFPDADFNGNGVIDVGDAAKIAWFGVGKIPAL
jgi:outer membrane protein assembly factor BamB/PKD repeat protein